MLILLNFHVIVGKLKTTNNDQYICGQDIEATGSLFTCTSVHETQASVVKILEPMSAELNYFEFEIISGGTHNGVGIGLGNKGYYLDQMPGWKAEGVGYHADNGKLYKEQPYGVNFGPTCTVCDTMGCGIDFESEDSEGRLNVFFTKNNAQVSDYVKFKKPASGLYPLIGLCSKGEKVRYKGRRFRQTPIHLLKASSNSYYTYLFPIIHFILVAQILRFMESHGHNFRPSTYACYQVLRP